MILDISCVIKVPALMSLLANTPLPFVWSAWSILISEFHEPTI